MKNLAVQSLKFDDIKANLRSFLQGNPAYADFNFEGSGISTLVNLLAYQTHYIGYFVKMLIDESFVDSAHTKGALLSHAKRVGYIPRGKKSATATVVLTVNTTTAAEPTNRFLELERGNQFRSSNSKDDARMFVVVDGSTIYNRTVNGSNVTYVSDPVQVSEGQFRTWNFKVVSSIVNQRFIIKDQDVDIDSIRVRVKSSEFATDWEEYSLASTVEDLGKTSTVYFLTTDENGNYQLFFGDDVFGVKPSDGNYVEVTYVASAGAAGNGAKVFTFIQPSVGSLKDYSSYSVATVSASSGGCDPQTIDELRYAIPNHWRRQNRLVTASDYRSMLLGEYRNIDSINVWGGEDNDRKDYGKVYISIKPKDAERLTSISREKIRDQLIKSKSVVGSDVVFVDPEYIYVDINVFADVAFQKTSKTKPEMSSLVSSRIISYSDLKLSKFDAILSDVDMLNAIIADDPAFISVYTQKEISRVIFHRHKTTVDQRVDFGNSFVAGTVVSGDININSVIYNLKDVAGELRLFNKTTGSSTTAGTVNYVEGSLSYHLPAEARIVGYELASTGELSFKAVPSIPDIYTTLNKIIKIRNINVKINVG